MLVNGLYLALLFIDTVFANVCSDVYEEPSQIFAASLELYRDFNSTQCRYFIRAPSDHYIVLNFTRFGLVSTERMLSSQKRHPNGSPNCMPRVELVEVQAHGEEEALDTLCPDESANGESCPPQVFQSNLPAVILTYTWDPGTDTIMQLSFSFHKNGGRNYVLVAVVVVLAVVVLLVVILCVFNQFRVTNRFLHQHAQLPSDSSERNQLHNSSPLTEQRYHSEVVYVPGATSERLHQSQMEDSGRLPGDTSNLPPSIPISLDGEEGYQNSQHLLHQCISQRKVDRDTVCAPPNRTMCGDSPPHYHRAHSVGHLDKSRMSGGGGAGRMHRAHRDCTSSPSMPSSHNSSSSSHYYNNNNCNKTGSAGGVSNTANTHHYQRNQHSHHHQYHPHHHGRIDSGFPPPPSYITTTSNNSNIRSAGGGNTTTTTSPTSSITTADSSSSTTNNSSRHPSATSSGVGGVIAPSQPRPTRLFSAPPSVGRHSRRGGGSGSMSSTSSSTGGPPSYPPPEYSDLNEEEVFGFQRQSPEAR